MNMNSSDYTNEYVVAFDSEVYKRINLTEEQKIQLEKIYEILKGNDIEAKLLAFGIFKEMFPSEAYFNRWEYIIHNTFVSINEMDLFEVEIPIYYFSGVTRTESALFGIGTFENIINNALIDNCYFVKCSITEHLAS